MRIDTFCRLEYITKIDYIHIDVQGAESIVLSGLGDLRPLYIFAETCEFETYETGIDIKGFDQFMKGLGYQIEKRYEHDTLYVHETPKESGDRSVAGNESWWAGLFSRLFKCRPQD